ncbi:MAG TPA: hypothetical protein VGS41_03350, partial [Chthonomonadales bacterium]|nr:hypothetical protein [Chthonomonadales bacterium]
MIGWMRVAAILCLLAVSSAAQVETPLSRAAGLTELPLAPWGPYSRAHAGPCCLVDRWHQRLFAFPVVVGELRNEVVLENGETHAVTLARRLIGLSPVQARQDDATPSYSEDRVAHVVDSDASGILWRADAEFQPSGFSQPLARSTDLATAGSPAGWGAATVQASFFPVHAQEGVSGLIVRLRISNRSAKPERFYADLLGGADVLSADFRIQDLHPVPAAGASTLSYPPARVCFGIAADAPDARFYSVSGSYFSSSANEVTRAQDGALLPAGLVSDSRNDAPELNTWKDAQSSLRKGGAGGGEPRRKQGAEWALTRVQALYPLPGSAVTVTFCVAAGTDTETATSSARRLLDAVVRNDAAYAQAREEHKKACFHCANAALRRLMAVALTNAPLYDWRRVGTPSRKGTSCSAPGVYDAALGGMIALAWQFYRPDLCAAQLTAFFLSTGAPNRPVATPRAIAPTNFLALWDLYERAHDLAMLRAFYPFALRRYDELLQAGRSGKGAWLFRWPPGTPEGPLCWTVSDRAQPAVEYSAYVVRTARIMWRIAWLIHRPVAEQRQFEDDSLRAARAMNALVESQTSGGALRKSEPDAIAAGRSLAAMMPLLAGPDCLSGEIRSAALGCLHSPLMSDAGLRRAAGGRGSNVVQVGSNWLVWKALLDYGAVTPAREIASSTLAAYSDAALS